MIETIIINVFIVLIVLFASYSYNSKKYLALSFLTLFIFLAIRFDFGNDYMNYYNYFKTVHNASLKDLLDFSNYNIMGFREIGYTWLNRLFPNFFIMIAILSLFTCLIYYQIIVAHVTPNLFWLSLFILVFDPGLILVQSSAIRQTIAVCIFIYSIKFLIEKNFWKYIILVLLASSFHLSALILLPLYFIVTPNKWSNGILVALFIGFLFVTFFGYVFLDSIDRLTQIYFPRYREEYLIDIVSNSLDTGVGFVFLVCTFLFILWSHNKGEGNNIIISKLTIIGFVLFPMGMYLNMIGRIGMYFDPFIILSLPFAISLQKSWQLRICTISFYIFFYFYSFSKFFKNPVWEEKFSIYKTIFSHI